MADGSSKPISEIRVGDLVYAEDPVTGEAGAYTVTGVWAHEDDLLDLRLTDGTVTTTADHPFWSERDQQWRHAGELPQGDHLRVADGGTSEVIGTVARSKRTAMAYNLTVDHLHTYYVFAGNAPVLVHNTGGCGITELYHGADIESLVNVLNNGLDASAAAAKHTDGPGGFFMATHIDDAEFFAVRNGTGAVIKVRISDAAMAQLRDAGAVSGPIPIGPKSPAFVGHEFHVPTGAFDLFNSLRASGEISVSP